MIDCAPTALAVVDRDERLTLTNLALTRLFESSLSTETTLAQLVDGRDLAACRQALETATTEGRSNPVELRLRSPEPTVWCRVSFAALAGWVPPSVVGTFENITEQRSVFGSLRETSERYRLAVDRANDIIFNISLTGHFTFVNPTACLLSKYLERELIGMHYRDLIREDARADAEQFYHDQVAQRIPSTYYEFPMVARDGEQLWLGQYVQLILDGNQIVNVQALARDITKRRRAEEALRQSQERLRAVVGNAPIVLWATDQAGHLTLCEGQVLSKLGLDSTDLTGRPVGAVIQDPKVDACLDRALRGETLQAGLQSGRQLFDAWFSPIRGDHGDVTGVIGVVVDVSDRKRLQDRLHQAEKLESVGRLAGGVAHDLNNQLTAIMGFAELLRENLSDDDENKSSLVEISKAGRRAASVTEQLLAYGRKQPRLPKVVDLNDVVTNLEPLLRQSILQGARLDIRLSDALEPVHADPTQLERCVINLALNARDASAGPDLITISTEMMEISNPTTTQTPIMSPGRYVTLAVTDTGLGMDDKTRRRVFEPFFTTKEVGKGTGLGLASVYDIVKQSAGYIWVTSAIGRGATFRILLPVAIGVDTSPTMSTTHLDAHPPVARPRS